MNTTENNTETGNEKAKSVNNISTIVKIQFLTPENASFSVTENGFLKLTATVPNPEKDNAVESIDFERVFLHRAFPFDMPYQYISVFGIFPKPPKAEDEENKEKKENKDSVEDNKEKESGDDTDKTEDENKDSEDKDKKEEKKDGKDKENVTSVGELKEIGIISRLSVFEQSVQQLLRTVLNNKYFTSIIEIIYSVKDKYGYSYWDVKTNVGRIKFTVHDTYRSLVKITPDRVMVNDINGNRYEIPSLAKFDKNSFRKIELFF